MLKKLIIPCALILAGCNPADSVNESGVVNPKEAKSLFGRWIENPGHCKKQLPISIKDYSFSQNGVTHIGLTTRGHYRVRDVSDISNLVSQYLRDNTDCLSQLPFQNETFTFIRFNTFETAYDLVYFKESNMMLRYVDEQLIPVVLFSSEYLKGLELIDNE